MTPLTTVEVHKGFGQTSRKDAWWLGPLLTLLGLVAFLIYANFIVMFVPGNFEIRENTENFYAPGNKVVAPYLAPFHSPLIYDETSPHSWIKARRPSWWPIWLPFTSAMLILVFPAGFRLTCYYYRKAYYRAFWADPVACAVGEPRKTYWGENRLPLILQNLHRYFLYAALVFIVFLTWDVILALRWPTEFNEQGVPTAHKFGMGIGTLLMALNVVLISAFTFGCNSLRHLVGGRLDCFTCPGRPDHVIPQYKAWRFVTWFNDRHQLWAWLSLFSVGFTDLYIRLCSLGIWQDLRLF